MTQSVMRYRNYEYLVILIICVVFGFLWLYSFNNNPVVWEKCDISYYVNEHHVAPVCTLQNYKECFGYHEIGYKFFQAFDIKGMVLLSCFIIPYLLYWIGRFMHFHNLHLLILLYFISIVPNAFMRTFLVSQAVFTAIILTIITVVLCIRAFTT